MNLEDIKELISFNKQLKVLCEKTMGIYFRAKVAPENHQNYELNKENTTDVALWWLCSQNIKALRELEEEIRERESE